MFKIFRKFFFFFFLILISHSLEASPLKALPLEALEEPALPSSYVNDYVGLLDASTKQGLENELKEFENQTSNQIVIAIFPSLEGENLEDFSIRLAQKWKVGQKGKDNGVILLVFKKDRKLRIEVGYGLEGVLTDALSKSIIQNEMLPSFKQGDYSTGIQRGAAAIQKAIQGEYKAESKTPGWNDSDLWVFLLIILVFFILPLFKKKGWRNGITLGSGGWSSGSSWGGSGGGFSGGGGSFGGGGSSGSW